MKRLLGALALLILASGLTACGSTSTYDSPRPEPSGGHARPAH